VHGDEYRAGLGARLTQPAGGLDPVEHRHGDVHQYELGAELDGRADCLLAVAGLAYDVEAGLLHGPPQPLAEQFVVVDQQEAGIGHSDASRPVSSSTWIHVPPPGCESTRSRAPMALARSRMAVIPDVAKAAVTRPAGANPAPSSATTSRPRRPPH